MTSLTPDRSSDQFGTNAPLFSTVYAIVVSAWHHRHRAAWLLLITLLALGNVRKAIAGDAREAQRCAETCRHGKSDLARRQAAIDAATGRDRRTFPPDRLVDHLHMKLQMRFEDLNQRRFTAVQTLAIAAIGKPCSALTLDAVNLRITSVRLAGTDSKVEYAYDGQRLAMRFDPPLPVGERRELIFEYVCERPYDGMFFTPASPDAPDYTPEVHTQGQAESNRHWFIAHDYPNERLTTELIVDVPAGFAVSSNGRLVSSLTSGDRAVWHWIQDKPHVNYLVSLIIGRFDVVDLTHPRVPLKVWAPLGRGHDVQRTYGRTGEMLDMFERLFGMPYPWDRYDQLIVKNFNAGGMENTAATTMYGDAIYDETALLDDDIEDLIAHELCHQWTGNLFTCKSWAHIWLNEGFAEFGNMLWYEQRGGQDEYLEVMYDAFGVAKDDRTSTNTIPMVSPIYDRADDVFERVANPYPKGAAVLHMLRRMLGEDVFWRGVRLFISRHAYGEVETNDLRYAMEEVSGLGLEWFFEQWCFRPGTPELDITHTYDVENRVLTVRVEQTQKIDDITPAFRFSLPVLIRMQGVREDRRVTVLVDSRSTVQTIALDAPPVVVAIDPDLHVLKTVKEQKPLAWWTTQATSDAGTIASRRGAIEALGGFDAPETIKVLAEVIGNNRERPSIRNAAVESLTRLGSIEARRTLRELALAGVSEAKVRVSLVRAVREDHDPAVTAALARIAASDISYAVRAAAIEGLAHRHSREHADLLVELTAFASHRQQVRNAALRALADMNDARGLGLAVQYAAYGNPDRARPIAIACIARLAGHDPDTALDSLIGLLDDPEQRAVRAAGEALASLRDPRSIPRLQKLAESAADPALRAQAREWLTAIGSGTEPDNDS